MEEEKNESYISRERERIAEEYRKLAFGESDTEVKCSEKLRALEQYSRTLDIALGEDSDDALSLIVIYDYD